MPLSFRQAGNLFVAGPNINIYPSGNTYAISGSASGGGGVTGLTSAGTGNRLVFSSITTNNTVLVQKSLSAGTGVAITEDIDGTIIINTTTPLIGTYVSAITSAGTGNRLIISSITNNNLIYKTISAGTGISITESNGTLTFSASSGSGTIISGTNIGTGVGVFSGVSSTNLVFRTIKQGSNAGVFLSGNDIIISATTGAINGITAITNVGGGILVASSVTSSALISRTISGANGIDVVESGNLVLIRPSNSTPNRFYIAGTGGLLTTGDFFQLDSTVGTAAFGFTSNQNNVTSRLLIAAGTGAISHLRLTSFAAAYSGASNGDIWYNSASGNSLFFNKGTSSPTPFIFKDNNYSLTSTTNSNFIIINSAGTISASRYIPISLGIFNSITSTTISGTSEISILNTGSTVLIGTNVLNSSSHGTVPQLITGKKYRFNARGTVTTSSSADLLEAKLKLGSVIIASSSTSLQNSISSKYFEIDCTFTIRSQGASGKVIGSGKMMTDATYLVASTSPIAPITSLGEITINTTVDTAFNFTLKNTTQVNNIYTINEATLEYLN